MGRITRKINFFELTLLIVGVGVLVVGFMIINNPYEADRVLSWDLFQTVFVWLVLIVLLVLAATMEDVKEELAIVINEQTEETRLLKQETSLMKQEIGLLKEIESKQLEELKLLRKKMTR
jgi:multisubunit Na+/H+ antiporter MnhF subunit